jgi:hypothetical protein
MAAFNVRLMQGRVQIDSMKTSLALLRRIDATTHLHATPQ